MSPLCWKHVMRWNISDCVFLKALFISISATPHPFYIWLFCLFRHWFYTASWQMCGDLPALLLRLYIQSWYMGRKKKWHESHKNFRILLTYSLHLSSLPVGAQYGNPLRTHYVKSIPFDTYPMPSSPSTPASGKCGHQYSTRTDPSLCVMSATHSYADTYCTPSATLLLHRWM